MKKHKYYQNQKEKEKMAMERMVTRTIQKKVYVCKVFDNVTEEMRTAEFVLTDKVKDNDVALKMLKKRYDGDSIQILKISDTKIEEKLYAMSEVDFLKYAHIVEKDSKED